MRVAKKVDEMERKEITAAVGYETESFRRTVFIEEEMRWDGYTLDEIVAEVERIRAEYSDRFSNIRLDKDYVRDYDGERTVWKFIGNRMETDAEYAARVNTINQRKAEQEARDRAEFERLKAKFGG